MNFNNLKSIIKEFYYKETKTKKTDFHKAMLKCNSIWRIDKFKN